MTMCGEMFAVTVCGLLFASLTVNKVRWECSFFPLIYTCSDEITISGAPVLGIRTEPRVPSSIVWVQGGVYMGVTRGCFPFGISAGSGGHCTAGEGLRGGCQAGS
uniref:Secreted protein n=1 Tax=Gopherus agassizii TaxID=38772 RepID=A0A452GPP1_9SAUR